MADQPPVILSLVLLVFASCGGVADRPEPVEAIAASKAVRLCPVRELLAQTPAGGVVWVGRPDFIESMRGAIPEYVRVGCSIAYSVGLIDGEVDWSLMRVPHAEEKDVYVLARGSFERAVVENRLTQKGFKRAGEQQGFVLLATEAERRMTLETEVEKKLTFVAVKDGRLLAGNETLVRGGLALRRGVGNSFLEMTGIQQTLPHIDTGGFMAFTSLPEPLDFGPAHFRFDTMIFSIQRFEAERATFVVASNFANAEQAQEARTSFAQDLKSAEPDGSECTLTVVGEILIAKGMGKPRGLFR